MAKIKRKTFKAIVKKQREERAQVFLNQLYAQHDTLSRALREREAMGDFDANAKVIRETLQATFDILNYLIELRERDAKRRTR